MTADAAEIVRLAERVEQGTGADREQIKELLWEAFRTVYGAKPPRLPGGSAELDAHLRASNPFFRLIEAGAFLDAAMSLVPEEMEWKVFSWRNASKEYPRLASAKVYLGSINDPTIDVFTAATPALALTAAALRARAASSDGEG